MPVQQRPSGYVSRTVVPRDLRPVIRRREVVRNLKTGSSREAKWRAAEFEGRVAALFRRLRQDGAMMDRAQLDALTACYLNDTLDDAEVRLAQYLPETSEDASEVWQDEAIEKIKSTEHALSMGDYQCRNSTHGKRL
jgi:Domain of unknown function (DUF6538)